MSSTLAPPARIGDVALLADWAELSTLVDDSSGSALNTLDLTLRQSGYTDLRHSSGPEDPTLDEQVEQVVQEVSRELQWRSELLRDTYPFEVDRRGELRERMDWRGMPTYVFCLSLSNGGVKPHGIPEAKPASIFEQISTVAAAEYLGGNGLHFGFPRVADEMKGFKEALEELRKQIGEGTVLDKEIEDASPQDAGVDVAAWKHFPDRREGKALIFGQCKAGDDWEDDLGKPNFEDLRMFFPIRTQPIRAMFIPHTIAAARWAQRANSAKGILFDRFRVTRFAGQKVSGSDIPAKLVAWTEAAMGNIKF